jgi:signal transduction histidine kinase
MVRCDPELIRQALANLVGNALRFTEAGGTVRVTATKQVGSSEVPATEDEADEVVCLEVADTGPGIPPEEQPFLFDDFEHAESLTVRRERRSGVGLALARRIVELHGGRIWVESTGVKGEGSRFFIEVPAYAEVRCSV